MAIILAAMVPWAIWKAPPRFSCHAFECVIAALAIVPCLQFVFGQIPYFGQLWISIIYLLGFLLAILAGRFLEASNPRRLVDLLSMAIGLAALVSVLFQLYQWQQWDGLGIWLTDADPSVPTANLGQRNQLATLLLWGLLAISWGWVRSYVGVGVALSSALLILFGIALTGSRTAWIGLCLVVIACLYWRHLWRSKYAPWIVTGLAIYFFCCVLVLKLMLVGAIKPVSTSDVVQMEVTRALTDSRLAVWKMFIGAVLDSPVFGYGWGQIAGAHLSEATQYPAQNVVFSQSHNLFLDLVLWCGIPIGLSVSAYLVHWFWRLMRQVNSHESAVVFLFVLVVANHSMFEFPLHYAYFLLPLGVFIGVLSVSEQEVGGLPEISKQLLTGMCVLAVSMFGVTVVDYFKIEHSYQILRMEWAGFNLEVSPQPPKVIALNQWYHIVKQARVVPTVGMSLSELQELRTVALQAHKPIDLRNLAIALDLNGITDEAELWLERLCRVSTEENCLKTKADLASRRVRKSVEQP